MIVVGIARDAVGLIALFRVPCRPDEPGFFQSPSTVVGEPKELFLVALIVFAFIPVVGGGAGGGVVVAHVVVLLDSGARHEFAVLDALRVDPRSQLYIRGVPLGNQAVSVLSLELKQLLKHGVPLAIVVSLHLVLDLPLKANRLQSTTTLFRQTRIGQLVELVVGVHSVVSLDGLDRSLQLCVFVALCLHPLAKLVVLLQNAHAV